MSGASAAERRGSPPGDLVAGAATTRLDPARFTAGERAIFLLVCFANLVPIWALRYFPGQDTANHLYTVEVLRSLLSRAPDPAFARVFAPALGLGTNVTFHLLLLGLVRLVPLATAHRIVLSLYGLALPLAALFCLRAAAPRNRPLVLLLLPLVFGWFALQGLYNYILSLPPALVWLGLVGRDGGRPRLAAAIGVALAALLVYLSHVGTFVALGFVTTLRVAFPGDGSRRPLAERLREAWPLALALLPAVAIAARATLAGIGSLHAPLEPTVSRLEMSDPLSAFATFFLELALRFRPFELAFLLPPCLLLLAVPIGAAIARRRAGRALATPEAPSWPLVAAAALGLLYFLLPHIVLGSDASPRLRPLVLFCLLCYAGIELGPRLRRRLALLALVAGLGGALALGLLARRLGRDLDDYTSGIPYVKEGSRLYPIAFDPRAPSVLVKPFLHAWGYYGIARHVVTPFAFAWHESRFPLRYRELPLHARDGLFPSDAEDEPYALVQGRLCASVRRFAPSISCAEVRRSTEERLADLGAAYDYVLTWAAPADFTTLLRARGFALVHAQGRMALWTPPILRTGSGPR